MLKYLTLQDIMLGCQIRVFRDTEVIVPEIASAYIRYMLIARKFVHQMLLLLVAN